MDEDRHKLLKTWAQSFLIGVPKVAFGFRDDQGILREIKTYETSAIPREVRGVAGMWDPSVCLAFAAELLRWLRTVLKEEVKMYNVYFGAPFQGIAVELSGDGT
ncbi:hypothetical protein BJ742DRAFT_865098 [Cladochytrium replicatum]|nr:hypothetical protein BJ742DRAFT_865098 [Cladochytrium replicatum]